MADTHLTARYKYRHTWKITSHTAIGIQILSYIVDTSLTDKYSSHSLDTNSDTHHLKEQGNYLYMRRL